MHHVPTVAEIVDNIRANMNPDWFDGLEGASPFQVVRTESRLWIRPDNSGKVFRITVDELGPEGWPGLDEL